MKFSPWWIPPGIFPPTFFNTSFFHYWYCLTECFVIFRINLKMLKSNWQFAACRPKWSQIWKFCSSNMIIGHCYNPVVCLERWLSLKLLIRNVILFFIQSNWNSPFQFIYLFIYLFVYLFIYLQKRKQLLSVWLFYDISNWRDSHTPSKVPLLLHQNFCNFVNTLINYTLYMGTIKFCSLMNAIAHVLCQSFPPKPIYIHQK